MPSPQQAPDGLMHWAWHREILLGRGKADREEPPNKGPDFGAEGRLGARPS